jgi:hypothetical protein
MSREFLQETTTVTIAQQHFDGQIATSTSTVNGIHCSDLARAARCAMLGLEFAEETVDETIPKPPCEKF